MTIFGRTLKSKSGVRTKEDCSQVCLENSDCIAFYLNKRTKKCYLRSEISLYFYGTVGININKDSSSGVRCDRSFPGFPADRTNPAAAAEITNGEFTNGKIRNVKSFCSIRLKIFSLDTFHLKCKFDLKNYFRT